MAKGKELELMEGGFYYCETNENHIYNWIFQKSDGEDKTSCMYCICINDDYFGVGGRITGNDDVNNLRVATNEEQQLLITQIKNYGK